ncbi:MAG: lamin tail domain-containing protein, partial [Verrucomicrobiota bacterium]|nr:lamin tail domain-containing protein [Verrucomicrobiota bacterium]
TSELAARQGLSSQAWLTELSEMKTYLSSRTRWIDAQFFQPPAFSHPGGTVSTQFALTISNNTGEAGTIFFTLDGNDPINGGGTIYTRPISLNATAHVRARVLSTRGEWSAINEASYVTGTPPRPGDLVLSEIMYHPLGDPGAEFIELLNINPVKSLDLALLRFAAGVEFTFPVGATLAPGERIIVVRNRSAFEAVHGPAPNVVGEFQLDGALDNSGDHLTLLDARGGLLLDFSYGDDPPWPESADGDGDSLVLVDPLANPDHGDFSNWRSSTTTDGNPGTDDRATFSGDPVRDRDRDGIPALIEFLLGTPDIRGDRLSDFFTWNYTPGGETELLLAFSLAAHSIEMPTIEFSADLKTWQAVIVEPALDEHLTGGRARYRWLLPAPQPAQRYFRIRVVQTGP